MNNRYRFRAHYLSLTLIFFYVNQTQSAVEAIKYICWKTCEWVGNTAIATATSELAREGIRRFDEQRQTEEFAKNYIEHIQAQTKTSTPTIESSKSTVTTQPVQQVTVKDVQQQTTAPISNSKATSNAMEKVSSQPSSAKSTNIKGGLIIGGVDAHLQFLQPGEPQPQELSDSHYFSDGKGNVGYKTSVGNTGVSVGTDIESVVRFTNDAVEILSSGNDAPKTVSQRIAAEERAMFAQLDKDTQAFKQQCLSLTEEQLLSKKMVLQQQRKQVITQGNEALYRSQSKKYSKKSRQRASVDADKMSYANRKIGAEINVINQQLEQKTIRQQATHVAAANIVMESQTVDATGATKSIETKTTSVNSSTTTSLLTPSPSPSVFTQAKDGATFFVKNVELEGTLQVVQVAEISAVVLKDDGVADYLLGKPAKVVLGSCVMAVGIPAAIGTMCPPCAPFMAPALGVGFTYCSGALPVTAGVAVIENGAHLAGYETTITQTRRKWHGDTSTPKKVEQSTAVDHNLIPKPNQGCGSTEQVEPMQLPGKPGTPLVPEQNPGYPGVPLVPDKPIGGYALPVEKPEPLINVPLETDWRDNVLTQDNKNDTLPKAKQYDGPKYNRTEDWVKSPDLPQELKDSLERTNLGMQGKRAFRVRKKTFGLTGVSEGEYVTVDAMHKDHLEVYDKNGKWTHVANFDGSRNLEKTQQGQKNQRHDLEKL